MNGIRAFTLIEMIVVLAIMMTVMAMLLPGIAVMQRKSDLYATSNVLRNVHTIQMRNARQFGSAGLIYGYTLIYSDGSTIPNPGGSQCAGLIKPWIIGAPLVAPITHPNQYYQNAPTNDLKADIGKQMFWSSADPQAIEFVDLIRPAGKVVITTPPSTPSTTTLTVGTNRYLHIGFSPRHGFVMADAGTVSTPNFTLSTISSPSADHQDVKLELWSTKGKRATLIAHITSTGIINVDGNL